MREVGIGIIGCGFFGRAFANIVNETEGMRTVAVFGGENAGAAAAETNSVVAGSVEELAEHDEVEAIIIASPNHAHVQPAVSAAKNGKHVFCEKPVALTLEDCTEMLNACRDRNVVFMAGHILHFMAGIRRLKERIGQGAIGTPILCHAERTGWEPPLPTDGWKKDAARSGGHLFHHIHELDLLLSIMGPAEAVFTAGGRIAHPQGLQDDVLLLTLYFSDGRLGTMQYGSGFRSGEHFVKINGTAGYALVDFKNSRISIRSETVTEDFGCCDNEFEDQERVSMYVKMDGGIIHGNPSIRPPLFLTNMMKQEMIKFRDVVRSGSIPEGWNMLFDGSAAYQSIAAASAAMMSLGEGRIMPIIRRN